MNENHQWLQWAIELQSLAQAGLTYGRDLYDLERYTRIREIAAEMMSAGTGLPVEKMMALFCNETGYQTPKLDTRAAVFRDGRILLVRENNGFWSLPGGWVDVNVSVGENAVKEAKEEAGVDVIPRRVIAVQDWTKRNGGVSPYGICKVFVLCDLLGGDFTENIETTASGYFAIEDLPPLSEEKNTLSQIEMCFAAARAQHWETILD
ncbi:MAG: NUDIX hydrolase [Oscillospiraceae bacterium]|nr:NUDIX hydrolase [Oscillospiraceae bacterium]